MKSPEEVRTDVAARLRRTWSHVVAGALWQPEFRLGTSTLTGRRLADSWPAAHRAALEWEDWIDSAPGGVTLTRRTVTLHGTHQTLPAILCVDTIDAACRLVGDEWTDRLARTRARFALLTRSFPELTEPAGILRATDSYSDVDFGLLCRAAAWFQAPHPAGLTARQIPIEGLGTKWLDAHESLVRRLAGIASLGLERGRPPRVHLTYLDPDHLANGGRRHDLATIGDVDTVAYRPRVVLISENRDTAQLFPPVVGGIAVEGEGRGAGAIAGLLWISQAPAIWYWGDMDADGLEILNGFRAAGLPARSLYMDLASYEEWERFGVDHDHRGTPLGPRPPRNTDHLEPPERDLYQALCSPDWRRHRRIEQERIPIARAADAIHRRES